MPERDDARQAGAPKGTYVEFDSLSGGDEILRRARYLCGHVEGIERMVREGRTCAEVLQQARAVRRASEKLEACCLMRLLSSHGGKLEREAAYQVVDLYRLSRH